MPSDNKMWDDIAKFHKKYGIPQLIVPGIPDREMAEFRLKFLREEMDEFEEAMQAGDRVKAFDALIDLVYVAIGTAYVCNFPFAEGWDIVQHANMQKVRAATADESKRGSQFDVVKPKGWVAPDLALDALLTMHEFYEIGGELPEISPLRELI